MSNYLNYLQNISNPKTFQRKYDYFKYNYGKLLSTKLNEKSSVLEIGPGLGEFVSYINSLGINNIDIIDNNNDILQHISSNFKIKKTFQAEQLTTIEANLPNYDAIVLTQVLEHIPKKYYEEFLKIIFNHLNENGIIIITVPNMGNPFTICERYADLTHQNAFTDVSLKEFASICKLQDATISIHNFNIPPYSTINLIRIIFQKIIHGIILLSSILNGGTYSKFLTPNITLVIKK